MVNEGIDNEKSRNSKKVSDTKKSKKCCDHSKYNFFIPASWVKHIHDEIKKRLLLGGNNLIDEIKDEKPNLSIKIIFLKVIHKNELFRIKVHNNILISLLKNNLKSNFEITNENIELYYNKEELLGTKSIISYNINKNHNVEVIVKDTKTVDEKYKNITDSIIVDEKDKNKE